MTFTWRNAFLAAAATLLWTGCSTSPPGAGLTNGEPLSGAGTERTAERTDLPAVKPTGGDESLAGPAADSQVNAPPAPLAPASATPPAKGPSSANSGNNDADAGGKAPANPK